MNKPSPRPHPRISPLWVALIAMFFQQSFTTAAKSAVPLVAPAAIPVLGVSAAYVGLFVGLSAFIQIFVMLGCGSIIQRYGGLRTSQIGLVLIAAGLAVAASGFLWPFLLAAVLIASGTSVATPASSQVLARYAKPKIAPLVFSAKQSSVPFGLMIGGFMVPAFVALFGWQGALLATGMVCVVYAVLLQPTRAELDGGRDPTKRFAISDVKSSFLHTVTTPPLRRLGFTALAFAGVQTSFISFYVLFLTESLGYSLAAAGGMFATATAASIPMRVVWGYLSSRWISAHATMVVMSLLTAVSCVLVGITGEGWARWQVLGAALVLTSTALSWQGVILSEIARLVPTHKVGGATGGVLAINAMGHMLMPLAFGAILALTESYSLGFFFVGIPSLLVVVMLLAAGKAESARPGHGEG